MRLLTREDLEMILSNPAIDHEDDEELAFLAMEATAKAQQELTNKEWIEWIEKNITIPYPVGSYGYKKWQARLKEVSK